MERYQVILAYDGSHFKGFQRQANVRTVQGVVESALRKLNWQGKSILSAGRTDTGSHATGQVIAFNLDWDHDPQELKRALNSYFPPDVVAREAKQVCSSFHPRYDASWRKYYYRIYCQSERDPFLEPFAWRVWPDVERTCMLNVAPLLVGTHDFISFGTPPQPGGNTVRSVLKSDWREEAPYLVYEIVGQAFLYHMVRRIVFMLVRIAQGLLDITDLQQALEPITGRNEREERVADPSKRLVHGLAPAQGLVLTEVHYPPEVVNLNEDKN